MFLHLAGYILAGSVVHAIALAIYNLTLHPLAKFPGPKLTAATGWYEFFVDLFGGQDKTFAFHIKRMHDQYGPIVRINPHELHVNDPDFFSELYVGGSKERDKYPPAAALIGMPEGIFGTPSHKLHRMRRGAIENMFSAKNVASHQELLSQKADLLCDLFRRALLDGKPLNIRYPLFAFTTDCFEAHVLPEGERMNLLQNEELTAAWRSSIEGILQWSPLVRQFPWMVGLAKCLPLWVVQSAWPEMGLDMNRYAQKAIRDYDDGRCKATDGYLWQAMLSADLSRPDKTAPRMAEEAMTLLIASGDTGARVLTVAMYFIHENPKILQRLREELRRVAADATDNVPLKELQGLPWLSAVIDESLRIANLITSRQPLSSPKERLHYNGWDIAPGVPVGMTLGTYLVSEKAYSSPLEFEPERWLPSHTEYDRNRKYFHPFHRGHRMCIAQSLARAEMIYCLSKLVRRFECQLYDVVRERDIDVHQDCFLGEPRKDTKGVRLLVTRDAADDQKRRSTSQHCL